MSAPPTCSATSTTEEEAIEYVAAVMQLYREQAAYLERVWKWVEKVGLDKIRAAIMDDHEGRRALLERFKKSQRAVRKDPWAERAAGRELHEFMPLAVLDADQPRSPPNERRHETGQRTSGSTSARCTRSRSAARAR